MFNGRPWNNGMQCMSFYFFMYKLYNKLLKSFSIRRHKHHSIKVTLPNLHFIIEVKNCLQRIFWNIAHVIHRITNIYTRCSINISAVDFQFRHRNPANAYSKFTVRVWLWLITCLVDVTRRSLSINDFLLHEAMVGSTSCLHHQSD